MPDQWHSRPFSIIDQIWDYWLLPADVGEQVRFKKDMRFDAEHFFGSFFKTGGFDGKSWAFRTRFGCQRDLLDEYLPAAKAAGLRVLVYLNVHWFSDAFPKGMLARRADGQPLEAYGNGWLTCPAGPFLQYSLDLAADLGEYDVDGAFLDGPLGSVCWCDSCRRLYRQRYGEELPPGPLTLAQRTRLEEWAAEKVASYVRQFRQVLRGKRPEALVYHNGSTLGSPTWANRAAAREADLLGIEGGFLGYSPMQGQFLYKTAATGKLLECLAEGKPTVSFNEHAFKGYDWSVLGRGEMELLYAATLATGANPWFHINYTSRQGCAVEVASEWNGFIAGHRQTLAGLRSAEEIALLWSDSTALIARSAKEEEDSVHAQADAQVAQGADLRRVAGCDHNAALRGAYALLARSGLPFRIVTEHELAEGLEKLDPPMRVLVAPSVVALNLAAFAGVTRFVRQGGLLVADDQFAILVNTGRAVVPGLLAALLGAVPGAPVPCAKPNLDYIARGDGWLFEGTAPTPIPRPTRAWECASPAAAGEIPPAKPEVLAFLHEPMAGRYDHLPPVGHWPAAILNTSGRGRVVWLPMNLFEHYQAYSFDDHRQMIVNALRRLAPPTVEALGLDGHGEIMVRRAPGRLVIHLLNYAGAFRPFVKITPLHDVAIRVRKDLLPRPAAAARALHAQQPLIVEDRGDYVLIRLPVLRTAETVVIEQPVAGSR